MVIPAPVFLPVPGIDPKSSVYSSQHLKPVPGPLLIHSNVPLTSMWLTQPQPAPHWALVLKGNVSRGLQPATSHSRGAYTIRSAIRELPTSQAMSNDFITSWVLLSSQDRCIHTFISATHFTIYYLIFCSIFIFLLSSLSLCL